MYIRKTTKTVKGKTYTGYLLVESVMTPKGPRQKTICSLGNLAPRPRQEWAALVDKVKDALVGQMRFDEPDEEALAIAEKVRARRAQKTEAEREQVDNKDGDREVVAVRVDEVEAEEVREAGAVHVGLHFYDCLGLDEILGGLSVFASSAGVDEGDGDEPSDSSILGACDAGLGGADRVGGPVGGGAEGFAGGCAVPEPGPIARASGADRAGVGGARADAVRSK